LSILFSNSFFGSFPSATLKLYALKSPLRNKFSCSIKIGFDDFASTSVFPANAPGLVEIKLSSITNLDSR